MYIFLSAFEVVVTNDISLAAAVQAWKQTSDGRLNFEDLLLKVDKLVEIDEEGISALYFFPPVPDRVLTLLKKVRDRPSKVEFHIAVDVETVVLAAKAYGRKLYVDVRGEEIRQALLEIGVPKNHFIHFA